MRLLYKCGRDNCNGTYLRVPFGLLRIWPLHRCWGFLIPMSEWKTINEMLLRMNAAVEK